MNFVKKYWNILVTITILIILGLLIWLNSFLTYFGDKDSP